MRFLFFFVHPAKFHVFKKTINTLNANGHKVDILITSKDVLENLIKKEGWDYTNIFPKGRKIKGWHPLLSSGFNFFRTIYKLYKYCRGKKYDLFITDDLLVYLSKWFKTPSLILTDDDITISKLSTLILSKATYILAPEITNLGKYSKKKISFNGYKELAYLHPDEFTPNINVVKKFNTNLEPYFLIRLVYLRAYHDLGINGLSNENLFKLVNFLIEHGRVYISSERKLPINLKKFELKILPEEILHVIYFSTLFIGDSQTMTSEAAVLGTPAFRCNDFAGKIGVMDEKEEKYGLSFNYSSKDFDKMYVAIEKILSKRNIKDEFLLKRNKMISEKINLSKLMIWLFQNYPQSIQQYKSNPQIQYTL